MTAVLLSCSTLGCGEPIDPEEGSFDDGDTGTPLPDVGTGLLNQGECLTDAKPGAYGYKYQCNGAFLARVGGTRDGEEYSFYVPSPTSTGFGQLWEPYEEAKVIACCGPEDPETILNDQPHIAESCLLDFRQQACISIALNLTKFINDGTIPVIYKDEAIALQNYIASNTTACMDGFVDTDPNPRRLEAVWTIPDDDGWSNLFTDAFIAIDYVQLANNVYAPAEPEECTSLHANNDEIFSNQAPPLITEYDTGLDEGSGQLDGPNGVVAVGEFGSFTTGCSGLECSAAMFSEDASSGTWAMDTMELHANGDLVVTDGRNTEVISNARVELLGQALGEATSTGGYEIDAGDALFVVVGTSLGELATIPVLNSAPITASHVNGAWTVDAFDLEYVDSAGSTWTLSIESTDWL